MPELAEVDLVCQQLDEHLNGRRLSHLAVEYPKWLKYGDPQDMVGQRLLNVRRWGKRLVWEWESGMWAGSLGMTGTVRLDDHGLKHPMLSMTFEHGQVTWYDPRHFGSLYVCASEDEMYELLGSRVGIDAAGDIDTDALRARFRTNVGLKAALLDQRWIAGIGNYLADEILWESQLHPGVPTQTVSSTEWERLNRARYNVITRALESGGLSMRDYVDVDGVAGAMGRQLHAYGRSGESCDRCTTTLLSGQYGGRTTVWCPQCQPSPA